MDSPSTMNGETTKTRIGITTTTIRKASVKRSFSRPFQVSDMRALYACICRMQVFCYHARMSIVIVGLGNPGKEYEKTRHNAGRNAVELVAKSEGLDEFVFNGKSKALVTKGNIGKESAVLVLPETMMNASGKAVTAFVKSVKAAKNLLVIHDDLDLPLGALKMVVGRGSGGHKGVESIMRALKT